MDSYYVANLGLLALYPVMKYYFNLKPTPLLAVDDWTNLAGNDRESQVFLTAGVILVVRFFRSANWPIFLEYFFLYFKLSIFLLLCLTNGVVAIWYSLAVFFVWIIFKQPQYKGKHAFVEIKDLPDFTEKVLRSDHDWCVVLHATWHSECISTMSLWAELSLKYTSDKFKFARVDVDESRGVARKCVVDTSGMSFQLPSLIVYESGIEKARFPPVDSNGQVSKALKYDVKVITEYLEIEQRYLASLAN